MRQFVGHLGDPSGAVVRGHAGRGGYRRGLGSADEGGLAGLVARLGREALACMEMMSGVGSRRAAADDRPGHRVGAGLHDRRRIRRRFASSKKLCGYTGLCPRVYQSGNTDRRGHLTHAGPKYLVGR